MPNALINFHLCDGFPCGEEASLSEIADYYGDCLISLFPKVAKYADTDDTIFDAIQNLINLYDDVPYMD